MERYFVDMFDYGTITIYDRTCQSYWCAEVNGNKHIRTKFDSEVYQLAIL